MKKAPRSSVGGPLVCDESDTVNVEEWSKESDTIAHRVRLLGERTPEPDPVERQKAREEARRKMEARKAEDKKIFDGLKRRYKRQAAENGVELMARILETEREQVVRLSARWVENVANVRAPSGVQRTRQLQSSNTALDELGKGGPTLWRLQGALRRPGWLRAGRAGRLPDYPQAYHSPRDEGALHPSRPSRNSFLVAVDREGKETCIVDPLHLQLAQDLGVSSSEPDARCMPCRSPGRRRWPKSRTAPTWWSKPPTHSCTSPRTSGRSLNPATSLTRTSR